MSTCARRRPRLTVGTYREIMNIWTLRTAAILFAQTVVLGCTNNSLAVNFAAERLRETVGDSYWKVEARDDEILIQAPRPIAFANQPINVARGARKDDYQLIHLKMCRFTLRFGRKLSEAEYKSLRSEHQAVLKEYEALRKEVRHISHKFDQFFPSSEADKKLLAEYRRAVVNLRFLDLPDLYTPDHSIRVYRSWADTLEYPKEKRIHAQVQELEDTLLKIFGVYHPRVAGGRQSYGRFLEATP